MCDFVCGTMSPAELSFHWSVIYYQMTFEWHTGHGSETSIHMNHKQGLNYPQIDRGAKTDFMLLLRLSSNLILGVCNFKLSSFDK